MKIDLLEILEHAMIGGRYGETSFIPNSPLVFDLYNNSGKNNFRDFLIEALNETEKEEQPVVNKKFMPVVIRQNNLEKYVSKEIVTEFLKSRKIYEDSRSNLIELTRPIVKELNELPFFSEVNYRSDGNKFYYMVDGGTFNASIEYIKFKPE